MTTVTVDAHRRVRLPAAKPRQVYAYETDPDGSIRLVPLPQKGPRRVVARLLKKGDRLVFEVPKGYRLEAEAIGKAVAEERQSRA